MKSSEIELRLPYPPTINNYYKHRAVKGKEPPYRLSVIKYMTKEGKDYRYTAAEHVWEQLGGTPPELRGRLAVEVRLRPGPGVKQDIDNCLKSLLDALEYSKVYRNDNQIDQLLVVRERRAAVGRVTVAIKTIGG